jgi:hypothetical protein
VRLPRYIALLAFLACSGRQQPLEPEGLDRGTLVLAETMLEECNRCLEQNNMATPGTVLQLAEYWVSVSWIGWLDEEGDGYEHDGAWAPGWCYEDDRAPCTYDGPDQSLAYDGPIGGRDACGYIKCVGNGCSTHQQNLFTIEQPPDSAGGYNFAMTRPWHDSDALSGCGNFVRGNIGAVYNLQYDQGGGNPSCSISYAYGTGYNCNGHCGATNVSASCTPHMRSAFACRDAGGGTRFISTPDSPDFCPDDQWPPNPKGPVGLGDSF